MTIYCSYNNQYYLDDVVAPQGKEFAKCVTFMQEYQPNTAHFNIVGPTGGYANYVGWLVFLDNRFGLVSKANKELFNTFQGANWPSYADYVSGNLDNVPSAVVDEIKELFPTDFVIDSFKSKLDFFENQIFSSGRTWHNWITSEWEYRIPLKPVIEVNHGYLNNNAHSRKNLLLTIDPELAYKSYLKFNSNLTYHSKEEFLQQVQTSNNLHTAISHPDVLTIDSSILFNPTLDHEWYINLINWFGLDDNYFIANKVHTMWYSAHKRAETDLVEYFTTIYPANTD